MKSRQRLLDFPVDQLFRSGQPVPDQTYIFTKLQTIDIPAFVIWCSDFLNTLPVILIDAEFIFCPAGIDTEQLPFIRSGAYVLTHGIFAFPVFSAQMGKLDAWRVEGRGQIRGSRRKQKQESEKRRYKTGCKSDFRNSRISLFPCSIFGKNPKMGKASKRVQPKEGTAGTIKVQKAGLRQEPCQ